MTRATEAFWLLTEPFDERPDVRFLVPTRAAREALAALDEALARRPGWVCVTGASGVGKSVLMHLFVESLPHAQAVAVVADAGAPLAEVQREIDAQLSGDAGRPARAALEAANRAGHRPVVVLDGADALDDETVAALERPFVADAAGGGLLVDFVAVVDAPADAPAPPWAASCGASRVVLEPLDAEGTAQYVRRRVRLAAGGERELFDPGALDEVFRRTGGRPDAINRVCALALDRVAAAGGAQITADDVRDAAERLGELAPDVDAAIALEEPPTPAPRRVATAAETPAGTSAADRAGIEAVSRTLAGREGRERPRTPDRPAAPPPPTGFAAEGPAGPSRPSPPQPASLPASRPAPAPPPPHGTGAAAGDGDRGERARTSAWVVVASALAGSVIGGLLVLWATGQLTGPSPAELAVRPLAAAPTTTDAPAPDARAPSAPGGAGDAEEGAGRVAEAVDARSAADTPIAPFAADRDGTTPSVDARPDSDRSAGAPVPGMAPPVETTTGASGADAPAVAALDDGAGRAAQDGSGAGPTAEPARAPLPDVAAPPPPVVTASAATAGPAVPSATAAATIEPAPSPGTDAGPEPAPARTPLPLRDAPVVLDAALTDLAPAGVAWHVRLLTAGDVPVEHVEIAHAEVDGRLQTLAVLAGDGPRRPARLLDRRHAPGGESVQVFYPEERVVRAAAVDDPFAGTGFRYDDFLPLRAVDFEPIRLEGDQLAGQPIFVVTARPLHEPALDRVELWIRERDMRLLEWRAFAPGSDAPVRRVVVQRPDGDGAHGARLWQVYGRGDRLVARAAIDATPLPADIDAGTFTFSRLSEPDFALPVR